MEEVLLNKNQTSGTTVYVFDTIMSDPQAYDEVYKSYMLFDPLGIPSGIYHFAGNVLYIRNGNNNFIDINEIENNYITGYTGILRFTSLLTSEEKKRYESRFIDTAISLDADAQVTVFYEDKLTNDVFLNIGLHRTFDALNTLSIYNTSLNSYPIVQSNTGVVFGRLEATQKVLDPDSGKNIRIPLRNVPIGIFNGESQDFPLPTSVDDNGNRLQLNVQPIIEKDNYLETEYFNQKSKNFDDLFLKSPSTFNSIPSEYKYITKTNNEGEFIIYDVPVGNNTIVFDVDLLQQGLTKDEVALNFFPYLNIESPNVDQIPHFFFRQIPVDVLPSWGDFQTGYTEVNISVNLDLRKWSTFFVSPINFDGKNLQQLQSDDGITTPLSVFVKDMTKKNEIFSSTTKPSEVSEIVEIQDLLKRNIVEGNSQEGQDYEWLSEFSQLKKSAEFFTNDFHAFKVPANMYNPNTYNSIESQKNSGIKKLGTWYCGYQFKLQYLENGFFRTTGFERQFINGGVTSKDNYHINKFNGYDPNSQNIPTAGSGKGIFPYEKPWSYKYPNLASIPKPPSIINPAWIRNSQSPKYLDGDMIGLKKDGVSGGFGLQQKNDNASNFFPNKFSKRVSAGFLYKYEYGVSWHEVYANGFLLIDNIPNTNPILKTRVFNGERYQRVEAGFGYYLKPEGWPYIYSNDEYDFMIQSRIGIGTSTVAVTEDATFDITLNTDPTQVDFAKEGGMDIYKIITPEDILEPDPNITPTFGLFNFGNVFRKKQRDNQLAFVRPFGTQSGQGKSCYPIGYFGSTNFFFSSYSFKIYNRGTVSVTISGQKINPGEFYDGGTLATNPGNIRLPGNDLFDITTFSFTRCNYDFVFGDYSEGTGTNSNDFSTETIIMKTIGLDGIPVAALDNGKQYNLKSQYQFGTERINIKDNGACGDSLVNGGGKINGVILGADQNCIFISGTPYRFHIFEEGALTITCDNSFFRVLGGLYSYYSIGIERV